MVFLVPALCIDLYRMSQTTESASVALERANVEHLFQLKHPISTPTNSVKLFSALAIREGSFWRVRIVFWELSTKKGGRVIHYFKGF